MFVKSSLIPLLLGIYFGASVIEALQLNVYSDDKCGKYLGTYYPGDCDAIQPGEGVIGSWLIVCKNNFEDSCQAITFYSSNKGGCAGQYGRSKLKCPCNADPTINDSRQCEKTYGLNVHYWAQTDWGRDPIKRTIGPVNTTDVEVENE